MDMSSESLRRCGLCGQTDVNMDTWLGVCYRCLARAGQIAIKGPDLPQVTGFRLLRVVERGGMSCVFEAVRKIDGLRVALKLMAPEMTTDESRLAQFRRECDALRQLDHPGIVRYLDSGKEGEQPWLAMEFVDGPDLRQVLKRGPLSVARALEVAIEIGIALSASHAEAVVHRDIKPGNVLLDSLGKVKLTDFGMVRVHGTASEGAPQSTVMILVSGRYSAPEQESRGTADARADIYSLGALLHHLLTGNAPRVIYRSAGRERPGVGISTGLDRIIIRCLETEPDRRYRTMDEMVAALEAERRFLLNPRPVRLRRQLAFAGALLVIAALIALIYFGLRAYFTAAKGETINQQIAARLAPLPVDWTPQVMTNTLGMPFVSIPDSDLLFCIWETRVRDYAVFAQPWPQPEDEWVKETGFTFPVEKPTYSLRGREFSAAGYDWRVPGFPITPDHAVCGVSVSDAMAFCTWLTWKERREGNIRADQAYRLPTDEEWSTAAGLAPESGTTPEDHAASWPAGLYAYSWGTTWPAPDDLYNVAGDEVNDWEDWPANWEHLPRRDAWRGTAPINSVPPDARGLYHLTGNVWEWTETPYNQDSEQHAIVLRGGSWMNATHDALSLSFRDRDLGTVRMTKRGFRIVFQESGAAGWRYGAQ